VQIRRYRIAVSDADILDLRRRLELTRWPSGTEGSGWELGMASWNRWLRIGARLWADLMTALGYDRFIAHGGDLGAGVYTALALRHRQRLLSTRGRRLRAQRRGN